MKAMIVFAHPNPKSFNQAILTTVCEELKVHNWEFRVSDLYQMNWNPVLSGSDFEQQLKGQVAPDVANEQENIRWADMLIFIYPIWWLEQPAILKGWIDRVFTYGFAYRFTPDQGMEGLIAGKKAMVITTAGSDQKTMEQHGVIQAIKTCMVMGTLGLAGITDAVYKNFYSVPTVTDDDRRQMLIEVRNLIKDTVK